MALQRRKWPIERSDISFSVNLRAILVIFSPAPPSDLRLLAAIRVVSFSHASLRTSRFRSNHQVQATVINVATTPVCAATPPQTSTQCISLPSSSPVLPAYRHTHRLHTSRSRPPSFPAPNFTIPIRSLARPMRYPIENPMTHYTRAYSPRSRCILADQPIDSTQQRAPDHKHQQAVRPRIIVQIQRRVFRIPRRNSCVLHSQKQKSRLQNVCPSYRSYQQCQRNPWRSPLRRKPDRKVSDEHGPPLRTNCRK